MYHTDRADGGCHALTLIMDDPIQTTHEIGGGEYFRILCEHIGIPLIATDADLAICTWNAAAARMFGAGAERMLRTPIGSIIPKDRREFAEDTIRKVIACGQPSELEFDYGDSSGSKRELAVTVSPIVTSAGERIGASLCIRDITRRIAMQAELDQNRKMASLGEMAGAIAHHFNNILGGIITSVDYAHSSGDPAQQGRILEQTAKALSRATNLVQGLLAFAEGDRRHHDLSDFTETLLVAVDDVEHAVRGTDIEFVLDLPELPVIPVPRAQLLTALNHIVRNGIDAMSGSGTLTIAVELEEDRIITRITDTGCGLDSAAVDRVFEPFWTTKGVLASGSNQATGLGLAIAHGAIHALGGTITVSSKLGDGTRFVISIPWDKAPDTDEESAAQ